MIMICLVLNLIDAEVVLLGVGLPRVADKVANRTVVLAAVAERVHGKVIRIVVRYWTQRRRRNSQQSQEDTVIKGEFSIGVK